MRVRVGIVGVGYMGKTHTEALLGLDNAEVVAVTDTATSNTNAGESFASEYGVAFVDSLDSLVTRPDIDAVVITTPHALHMEHSLKAIQAGKHVLLEKPMEISLEKCDRIIEAADRAGTKLMVGHSHRYWPGDVLAKKLIGEGSIGDVVMIRDSLVSGGYRKPSSSGQPRSWALDPALYGPGGLLAWGCHCMDRFRFWLGSECAEVYSHGLPLRTEVAGELSTHMTMLRFVNGVSASLWFSETLPEPAWPRDHGCCRAEIVGERGLLDVNPYASVRLSREGTDEWEEVYRYDGDRLACWRDMDGAFVRCILEDTAPPVTGRDGRKAVEMCLAAYQSAQTGQVARLPL